MASGGVEGNWVGTCSAIDWASRETTRPETGSLCLTARNQVRDHLHVRADGMSRLAIIILRSLDPQASPPDAVLSIEGGLPAQHSPVDRRRGDRWRLAGPEITRGYDPRLETFVSRGSEVCIPQVLPDRNHPNCCDHRLPSRSKIGVALDRANSQIACDNSSRRRDSRSVHGIRRHSGRSACRPCAYKEPKLLVALAHDLRRVRRSDVHLYFVFHRFLWRSVHSRFTLGSIFGSLSVQIWFTTPVPTPKIALMAMVGLEPRFTLEPHFR